MFRLTLTKTINTSSSTLQQAVCLFLFMKSLSNISSDNHLNIFYTKQIGIDLKVTGKMERLNILYSRCKKWYSFRIVFSVDWFWNLFVYILALSAWDWLTWRDIYVTPQLLYSRYFQRQVQLNALFIACMIFTVGFVASHLGI